MSAWAVEIDKRYWFRIEAATEDEARAYAVMVSAGDATRPVRERVTFLNKTVHVAVCEPAAVVG